LPAPLFLFLSGVSLAMVTQRLHEKQVQRSAIAKTTFLRGAEIYALGLLFRVQEFALGYPRAPWTDLLRVDILNMLGLSIVLMAALCWLTAAPAQKADATARSGRRAIIASLAATAAVSLATPLLWTTYRVRWLPWPVESYINGVHTFDQPQPWLFPVFPWSAFAFTGLAIGFLLFSSFAKKKEGFLFFALGAAGVFACGLSVLFDVLPARLYPAHIYDYWHTSPNFFLMRCGILRSMLFGAYVWCRWGAAQSGFSPVIQLGKTSLLVYWVHIEFVYGRFSILPKGQCSIGKATGGLLLISLAMLILSVMRTRWKNRPARVLETTATAPAAAES
jgi:Heparan-alpha-glucosaminide N-acetyltransferase, catalytic